MNLYHQSAFAPENIQFFCRYSNFFESNPERPDEFVKKIAQSVAQPIHIYVKIFTLEKVAQNVGYLCNFQKKTAKSKQSANGGKFAQSGHPGLISRFPLRSTIFCSRKTRNQFRKTRTPTPTVNNQLLPF
jgi:hypothetical protein